MVLIVSASTEVTLLAKEKYQCKYCHVIIVTKNEVTGSRPIGEYTIWHPQEPVSSTLLILYTTNFYYESGKELSGYEFH